MNASGQALNIHTSSMNNKGLRPNLAPLLNLHPGICRLHRKQDRLDRASRRTIRSEVRILWPHRDRALRLELCTLAAHCFQVDCTAEAAQQQLPEPACMCVGLAQSRRPRPLWPCRIMRRLNLVISINASQHQTTETMPTAVTKLPSTTDLYEIARNGDAELVWKPL